MNQPNLRHFVGPPGQPVPAVDAADLKAVWNVYEDEKQRDPAARRGGIFVGPEALLRACSPQADSRAVIYRSWMLQLFDLFSADALAPRRKGGQLHEAVFRVGARMRLTWMAVGVPWNGLPFDVSAFLEEVRKKSDGV